MILRTSDSDSDSLSFAEVPPEYLYLLSASLVLNTSGCGMTMGVACAKTITTFNSSLFFLALNEEILWAPW